MSTKLLWILLLITINICAEPLTLSANQVAVGVYIVSIHDINFNDNTFGADFWIWTDYKNPGFQPLKTMEFVNAKSSTRSLQTTQQKEQQVWSQEKIQGTFRHSWDMTNFPFEHHTLSIVIEEALSDYSNLQYIVDIKNSNYAKDINIEGFSIVNMNVESTYRDYDTNFGDSDAPSSNKYGQLLITLELERISRMLFVKLHTALYAAFLVTAFCFPILTQLPKTPQMVGTILSAVVGSLFASIINLRTADSVIGRSESLTLVDRLHFITFSYFIILGLLSMIILVTRERWNINQLHMVIRWAGTLYIVSYIAINCLLVWWAIL